MVIMRIIIRVLLLPVRMCLTIIQLVVMFITWLSAIIFHVLSGIICITAILGYGFGLDCSMAGNNQNHFKRRLSRWK